MERYEYQDIINHLCTIFFLIFLITNLLYINCAYKNVFIMNKILE